MRNELLLVLSVLVIFSLTVLSAKLFGERGLVAWTCIATLLANIEVLLLVRAFGMEQTLGNVIFASTFLATDILSELYGKKAAARAVYIGVFASAAFLIISQSWLLYTVSENDWAGGSIAAIFSNQPRLVGASLAVYAVSQRLDVWLYHKWWSFTERRFGDSRRGLWLRNNGSTLVSQLVNATLFNAAAFAGAEGYSSGMLVQIIIATYVIYVVTSLADTPFIYLARKICKPDASAL
ncbi:MAG: queuosine precursor transporter [Oscillospiraceae bacterium]|jgi:uncharacterized integral membrane protein (TIGR00697 family)|nr:queuosine precursor transporter [Oscillospiraceae bacterium]